MSFSFDNKYVGIVGKPGHKGYLKLVKIDFNENDMSLSLIEEVCDTEIANWATWTCAFTKKGLFGTYDSAPDLYLINQNDFDRFTSEDVNDFEFLQNHCIHGYSLLCFSPSGNLMALTDRKYDPKSLGGIGHIPSNNVYIFNTDTREMLCHFQDQGDYIANGTVSQAGFSIDETKLMTVSEDGVIVVRNI